jgi:hypothetical protein
MRLWFYVVCTLATSQFLFKGLQKAVALSNSTHACHKAGLQDLYSQIYDDLRHWPRGISMSLMDR